MQEKIQNLLSKNIAIVYGGPSSEAEVSTRTANAFYESLKRQGFNPIKIEFSKNIFSDLTSKNINLVVNAMHGLYGEDGCLQGILEVLQIPYTHSGILASSVCMNKSLTKEIVKNNGVNVAEDIILEGSQVIMQDKIPFPFVIKPIADGSSVGVHIIFNKADLENLSLKNSQKYLVEKYIKGRELSVAVLDDKALGVVEIKPISGVYDYKSKYTKGATEYICPAQIPKEIENLALKYAEIAHIKTNCKTISRSDIIFNEAENKLYFLEINTHPGMTETSLVPKIAASKNISFDEIVLRLILTAGLEI
ncbi:MAG: D-alanine--D-alanine ligase [Rickettsiales bacterium]|nr:D-alanine--D-alanine ligase [Rickettsiales bacterium]